jgi:glucose/arabinose dehydrogenase
VGVCAFVDCNRRPHIAQRLRFEGATALTVAAFARDLSHPRWLYVLPNGDVLVAETNVPPRPEDGKGIKGWFWEIDISTGAHRVFASGLRNPVGLAWEPSTGSLWVTVNDRDELGSDLVPDYMTAVREGGFYGRPYSYYGAHVDTRVKPQRPDLVASAVVPDYALGPHTASLGLAYAGETEMPSVRTCRTFYCPAAILT